MAPRHSLQRSRKVCLAPLSRHRSAVRTHRAGARRGRPIARGGGAPVPGRARCQRRSKPKPIDLPCLLEPGRTDEHGPALSSPVTGHFANLANATALGGTGLRGQPVELAPQGSHTTEMCSALPGGQSMITFACADHFIGTRESSTRFPEAGLSGPEHRRRNSHAEP